MPELPPDIEEFNTIAGLIFAQLYRAFPLRVQQIDRQSIAAVMGVGSDPSVKLKSGRSFAEVVGSTVAWLIDENFVLSRGLAGEGATLSERGLAALHAVPPGLKQSLGSELAEAADADSSSGAPARIAELAGSLLGSFTGSLTKSFNAG